MIGGVPRKKKEKKNNDGPDFIILRGILVAWRGAPWHHPSVILMRLIMRLSSSCAASTSNGHWLRNGDVEPHLFCLRVNILNGHFASSYDHPMENISDTIGVSHKSEGKSREVKRNKETYRQVEKNKDKLQYKYRSVGKLRKIHTQ